MKLSPPVKDSAAIRPGRFRGAWRAAHEPVAGVSRPMRFIAYAVPLTVLPSALWRLPILVDGTVPLGERAYVALLSVVSEALAFTAVGLVARWGEVVPRWVPGLGGRRIPPLAAVVPAASGAAALTLLWTVLTLVTELMGTTIRGDELPSNFPGQAGGWEEAWFHICYIPLTLWGPLLAVLTVAYAVRRRRTRT
ncbi:hypothetical protein RI138_04310 [Streptomyces sp. C11-1]|uniref:Integral membrane protein n=1 Tax=Streptomyces durocortorensis TaxID=2811104 RepID=A0ABY9VT49_9ACTN|nr:hypothetical protein [Streptomyces durocortorensis]WNF26092.1 hypothetical protein RI138_04310 [Streptomyces durocortorensis]